MPLETAQALAQELRVWKPEIRIEFGTGGEPTLNPDFFGIVRALREGDPRASVMLQTNCEPWVDRAVEWIREWFDAGGNYLVLNCYRPDLKPLFEQLLPTLPYEWVDFYHNNPNHLSMYHRAQPKTQRIFLCDDLGTATVTGVTKKAAQRWLNNQGGSTPVAAYTKAGKPMPALPLHKRCTRVFRELVLSWDGRVPLCCYDWLDTVVVGKFPDQPLQQIWEGEVFRAARTLLYSGDRRFSPCQHCDYNGGFRIGLVEDPGTGMTREQALGILKAAQAPSLSQELKWIPLSERKPWKVGEVSSTRPLGDPLAAPDVRPRDETIGLHP